MRRSSAPEEPPVDPHDPLDASHAQEDQMTDAPLPARGTPAGR